MANKRISDIDNTITYEEILEKDEMYAVVDNGDYGTYKYNFSTLMQKMADFEKRIEELEKEDKNMNIDLPQQILNITPETYFEHMEKKPDLATTFDASGVIRFGNESTFNLTFQHETVIGLNITYKGRQVTGATYQYYIQIYEKYDGSTAVEEDEHIIDRIVLSDNTTTHQYTRWITVHAGSRIFIDVYGGDCKIKTTLSYVVQVFEMFVLMYSKYPLLTWQVEGIGNIKTHQLMTNSFKPNDNCKLFASGKIYYGTSSALSYGKFFHSSVIAKYQSVKDKSGIIWYNKNIVKKYNITILPTIEYAISCQSISSSITETNGSRLYTPALNDADAKGTLKRSVTRKGQLYMLPPECPCLSDIGSYTTSLSSKYEYRWISHEYEALYTNLSVTSDGLSVTVVDYNEDAANIFPWENDSACYAAIVQRQTNDPRLLKRSGDYLKLPKNKKQYELPIISEAIKDNEYYVLLKYASDSSDYGFNSFNFNVNKEQ